MLQIFVYLFAFFVTVPIIVTGLIYVLAYFWHRRRRKAVITAANWSLVFYIISVNLIFFMMFERPTIGYTLIFLLLILAVIVTVQWKVHMEVKIGKAFKILWRGSFLFFFILYVCATFLSILLRIFV